MDEVDPKTQPQKPPIKGPNTERNMARLLRLSVTVPEEELRIHIRRWQSGEADLPEVDDEGRILNLEEEASSSPDVSIVTPSA